MCAEFAAHTGLRVYIHLGGPGPSLKKTLKTQNLITHNKNDEFTDVKHVLKTKNVCTYSL